MPDGVVEWYDPWTGEADIAVAGRHLRARATDVEPVARRSGARVHFDVVRDHGVDRAVDVRLRHGTRVSHLQGRFGDLSGARRPDVAGASPYEHGHPGLYRAAVTHPLEVANAWANSVVTGDVDGALSLYAPDAVVHTADREVAGERALRALITESPVFDSHRHADVRGEDGTARLEWSAGPDQPGWDVRVRVEHVLIAEQWQEPPRPETVTPAPEGGLAVVVATTGDVGQADQAYAVDKVRAVVGLVDEPVLLARVRLAMERHASIARSAVVQVLLDLNGDPVRAHVASHSFREAADLVERRLRDKVQHRAEHRLANRRRPEMAELGEWRHAGVPIERPEHFPRPVEDRQLVRHKTFAVGALSPDEAVFDMDQLDFDFYLYVDLSSGADSLVERRPDGSLRLHSTDTSSMRLGSVTSDVALSPSPVPTMTVVEALERLNAGGEAFVFFSNAATGRGNVVYLRYDGHYGLITPE